MPIKSTITRVAFCGIQLVEVRHPAEDILPLWMYVEEEIVGIESSFGGNLLIYVYVLFSMAELLIHIVVLAEHMYYIFNKRFSDPVRLCHVYQTPSKHILSFLQP